MSPRTLSRATALLVCAVVPASRAADDPPSDVAHLIRWLLRDDRRLESLPFPEVIRAATGRAVLPADRSDPDIRRVLAKLGEVLDRVLRDMNAPGAAVAEASRINEASRYFEDAIRTALDAVPGLRCAVPSTREGRSQRAGYPDLRLVDEATGRVFYLDPKLLAAGSRESSFRTFYYEPKVETGKVLDDAVHLVVGIEHERGRDGRRRFARWSLVDLSAVTVRLKAEFESSNRELYRPGAIVASGAPE